ncbi:MAG TPA: hypothetical protein DEE98_01170 [Elusimicrobia bacterium]|nr:hypothetical protein [Elusimicrobiota bacterium]
MRTIILLTISNIFMTVAWYGHLKYKSSPLLNPGFAIEASTEASEAEAFVT